MSFIFFIFNFNSGAVYLILDLLHVLAQLEEVVEFVASLRHQILAPQLNLGSVVAIIHDRARLLIIDVHWRARGGSCYLLFSLGRLFGTLGVL